jgi:capsid protein
MDLRGMWDGGEFLSQIVNDPDAFGPIKTRLKPVQTRRLDTPPDRAADAEVTLGVKRNRLGRPLSYFIAEYQTIGVFEVYTGKFTEVPASDVFHAFVMLEPGQVRGVPWLATSPAGDGGSARLRRSVLSRSASGGGLGDRPTGTPIIPTRNTWK